MSHYKEYKNNAFNISDGNVLLDILGNTAGRQDVTIEVLEGEIGFTFEFDNNSLLANEDEIIFNKNIKRTMPKVQRIQVRSVTNTSSYRVVAGIRNEGFDLNDDTELLNKIPVTAFGDLRTAELHPQFQGSFEYTVDNTELNVNSTAGDGTVTQGSAMAVVSSSTTTGSSAMLASKKTARYRSGLGGVCRFSALFTAGVADTIQYVGLGDEVGSSAAFKNGYMVGFNGVTFGFHRFQNDTKITVTQANWDDPLDGTGASGVTLDQTKLNVFFIQFQYLGAGPIKIWIGGGTPETMHLVHTIPYSNLNTEPSTHNPNFRMSYCVNNLTTTTDIIVKSASYGYFIEGKTGLIELHQPQFSSGFTQKTGVGSTEVPIFTIRNKATYQSKTNFIEIMIENLSANIEASSPNNLGSIKLTRNATIGSPSYTDINTSDSLAEIDTVGTTISGGKEIFTIPLAGKNDRVFQNIVDYKLILEPGETITLSAVSANSATINGGLLWKELF